MHLNKCEFYEDFNVRNGLFGDIIKRNVIILSIFGNKFTMAHTISTAIYTAIPVVMMIIPLNHFHLDQKNGYEAVIVYVQTIT